jgi:hypothetical protein
MRKGRTAESNTAIVQTGGPSTEASTSTATSTPATEPRAQWVDPKVGPITSWSQILSMDLDAEGGIWRPAPTPSHPISPSHLTPLPQQAVPAPSAPAPVRYLNMVHMLLS